MKWSQKSFEWNGTPEQLLDQLTTGPQYGTFKITRDQEWEAHYPEYPTADNKREYRRSYTGRGALLWNNTTGYTHAPPAATLAFDETGNITSITLASNISQVHAEILLQQLGKRFVIEDAE